MADRYFEGNQKAYRQFLRKCDGDLSGTSEEMLPNREHDSTDPQNQFDVVDEPSLDWEDDEGNELIAAMVESEINECAGSQGVSDKVERTADKPVNEFENLLKCDDTIRDLTSAEKVFVNQLDDLMQNLGLSAHNNLLMETFRVRNDIQVKLTYKKVSSSGFARSRTEAFRTASQHFEATFKRVYFPELKYKNPDLIGIEEKLELFCEKMGLNPPVFREKDHIGLFTVKVSAGKYCEEESDDSLESARSKACLTWLNINGGDWKKKIAKEENVFDISEDSGDESIVFKSATTVKRTDAVPTRPFSSVNRSKAAAATGAGSFHGGKATDVLEEEYEHVEIIETFNKGDDDLMSTYQVGNVETKGTDSARKGAQLLSMMNGVRKVTNLPQKERNEANSPRDAHEDLRRVASPTRTGTGEKRGISRLLSQESSSDSPKQKKTKIDDVDIDDLLDMDRPFSTRTDENRPKSSFSSAAQSFSRLKPGNESTSSEDSVEFKFNLKDKLEYLERAAEKNKLSRGTKGSGDDDNSGQPQSSMLNYFKRKPYDDARPTPSTSIRAESPNNNRHSKFKPTKRASSSDDSEESSPVFKFSLKDKLEWEAKEAEKKKLNKKSANKSTKGSGVASKPLSSVFDYVEQSITDKKSTKKKCAVPKSSVFDYDESAPKASSGPKKQIRPPKPTIFDEDNIVISPIKSRKQKTARALSIAKFNEFSQNIETSDNEFTPAKKTGSKKVKDDPKQKKITSFLQASPDIYDILGSPPPRAGSSLQEPRIDLDMAYEEKLRELETVRKLHQQKEKDALRFELENAKLRDRLQEEVSEIVIEELFMQNIEFIEGVYTGTIETDRLMTWKVGGGPRLGLMYRMITHPFTDEQINWTMNLIHKKWIQTKTERIKQNDYLWKVVLPECFLKFYMDFFDVDRNEADERIRNTPLHEGA